MNSTPSQPSKYIESLDFIRGLAIIHIILYHYFLEWFHGSFLVYPGNWPYNLWLFPGNGVLNILKNIFSLFFVYGFSSVNVFLVLSGFVLTLSLLVKNQPVRWFQFSAKRVKRLLIPLYISVLLGIGILYLRNLLFPALAASPIYGWFDVVKLLFFPIFLVNFSLLQLFNGDYWYIVLILQLSLLFPLLFAVLKKIGPPKFLALTLGVTVLYRFSATYGASFGLPWLDAAPMGVIAPSRLGYYGFGFFIPRLFEFCLGMFLAYYYVHSEKFFAQLTTRFVFFSSIILSIFGYSLLFFRAGWIFCDEVIAIGLSLLLLNIGVRLARITLLQNFLKKLSQSAYETYLLHHYFLNYLLAPFLLTIGWYNQTGLWLALPVYLVVVISLGYFGFSFTERVMKFKIKS